MKRNPVALYVVIAVIVSIIAAFAVAYIGAHNKGVMFETKIGAVWDSNRVVLNNYTTKVQETAQVPTMYKDDLEDIIEKTFNGRYGENGSQAVFQWIQEQNLNLDPQLYRQIQQVMEAGRNEFRTSQQQLVDTKASYQAELNYFFSGAMLRMAGFPKIDLNKYQIITTEDVDVKFDTGRDSVIKLR